MLTEYVFYYRGRRPPDLILVYRLSTLPKNNTMTIYGKIS